MSGVLLYVRLVEALPIDRRLKLLLRAFRGSGLVAGGDTDVDGEDRLRDALKQELSVIQQPGRAVLLPDVGSNAEIDTVVDLPIESEAIGVCREVQCAVRIMCPVEPGHAVEGQTLLANPDEDEVLDEVRHVLAREPGLPRLVGYGHAGRVKIQGPLVAVNDPVIEFDVQVACRLIGIHAVGAPAHAATAPEGRIGRSGPLLVFAIEKEPSDLGQKVALVLGVPTSVHALPQPFVIQGDALAPVRSQNHRRQPPCPDGQTLEPLASGCRVPELHLYLPFSGSASHKVSLPFRGRFVHIWLAQRNVSPK